MTTDPQPLPLSQIAQFGGAPCSYERQYSYAPTDWIQKAGTVSGWLLNFLQDDQHRNFKLHLRPLSSLTDQEFRELATLAGITLRSSADIYPGNGCVEMIGDNVRLVLEYDGNLWFRWNYNTAKGLNSAPLYAYLRRKHFYVPGEIDEEYVTLIEP